MTLRPQQAAGANILAQGDRLDAIAWPQTGRHQMMPLPKPPRKLSREARRQQLIEATISVLAIRGYARATLTEVADTAGLSHGLVNFHFTSKDMLFSETLAYLSEEYTQNWQRAVAQAGPSAAGQLDALIRADFLQEVATPQRLAAWCAFWGEAQSRPLYQEKCGSRNARYIEKLEQICATLIAEGGYPGLPARIARAIRVASEGVWIDLVTQPEAYGLEEAMRTTLICCGAFFPKHFDSEGNLIATP